MELRFHWIKHLLWLPLLLTFMSACTDKPSDAVSGPSPLQISVASSSMTVSENRMVITLWDGPQRISNAQSVFIRAHDLEQEDNPVVWEDAAVNYSDYPVPYWVAYPQFTHAGGWLFDVVVQLDADTIVNGSVAANVHPEPLGVAMGSPVPLSETRTWDGQSDLSAITSDPDPNPAYYHQTIAEAVTNGKPTLIAFTTPGFCTSRICSPVQDTFDALWDKYRDGFNFVHVEVIQDFETLEWVPTMHEWNLVNEPWTYLIDSKGVVMARYDGPLSVREITSAIEELLDAH